MRLTRRGLAALLLLPQATSVAGPAPDGVAGPVTDIMFTQPMPAHPLMAGRSTLGYAAPVGGIGPYSWSLVSSLNSKYGIEAATGRVYAYYVPLGATSDSIDIVCTDGAGSRLQKTVPIQKTLAAPYLFFGGKRVINNNVDSPYYQMNWFIQAFGSDHNPNTDTTAISDPHFEISYATVRPAKNVVPPVGVYPVTVTSKNPAGDVLSLTESIEVVPWVPISRIQLVPGLMSSSLAPGVVVGRALATTPNNVPAWSLADDGGGSFTINAKNGDLTIARNLTPGPLEIAVTVTDRLASFTQRVALTVQPGTILPASNMTMTINRGLINAGKGQVVGAPAVKGVTGTPRWTLAQNNFKPSSEVGPYAIPRRYAIDAATGAITAPGMLSMQTDQLVVTCTDGINTCTRTFDVAVNAAPAGPTFHVGRGMAALHGANGFEHLREVYAKFQIARPQKDWPTIQIVADSDPNYFANDNISADRYSLRFGWHGPLTIIGVSQGGKQPRLGGTIDTARGGYDQSAKAFFIFGDGDFVLENVEVSHVHGYGTPEQGNPTHGMSGVRKDANSYGNLVVRKCRIHACDNGIETGNAPGNLLIEDCEIGGGGTHYVGAGATHNVYAGDGWNVTVRRSIFWGAVNGHDFKCRASTGLFEDNRFYDGEDGAASCQLEIPDGGEYIVRRNKFHKGPNALNGAILQFCAEMTPMVNHPRLTLLAEDNEFFITNSDGHRFGPPCAIRHFGAASPVGEPSSITAVNNRFWLFPGSVKVQLSSRGGRLPPGSPVQESGSVMLAAPPALDYRRPVLPGPFPRLPRHTFVFDASRSGAYNNFNYVQIDCGAEDLRLPVGSPAGTAVATCSAYGGSWFSLAAVQPDPRINPFGPGTAWALVPTAMTFGHTVPWAPAGRYAITANADGTGTITVAGALTPGVDLIYVRATGPGGTLCDHRLYVSVI